MFKPANRLLMVAATVAFSVALSSSAAAATIFYGADEGVTSGGATPNSDAAAALFDAAVGTFQLIDFESNALVAGNFANVAVATGVTVTLTGAAGGGIVADDLLDDNLGFNTTSGGSNFLQVWPAFDSAAGATVTYNFASPVGGFGFYLSDTETGFPGSITVSFVDGGSQSFNVTKTGVAGSLFWGITGLGGISSIALNTGTTGGTRDIWGMDDVRVAPPVPEPASLLLLGAGLAGLAARRRRA